MSISVKRPPISAMEATSKRAVVVVYDACRRREPDFPELPAMLDWAAGGAFPSFRPAARVRLSREHASDGECISVRAVSLESDGLSVELSPSGDRIRIELPDDDEAAWVGQDLVDYVRSRRDEVPMDGPASPVQVLLTEENVYRPLWAAGYGAEAVRTYPE